MRSSADSARDLPLDQLPDLLQRLLPHVPMARASWIVTQLTNRVETGQSQRIRPFELREGGEFLLGAVLLDQPAASSSLLAINGPLMNQPDCYQRSQPLINLIRQQLTSSKIRFMQTCADEESDTERLGQLGFERIADLALMVRDVPGESTSAQKTDELPEIAVIEPQYCTVHDDQEFAKRICRTAEESFESTLDCPKLARFRSPQDITAGFCLADYAEPELWRLVRIDGEDAGCIFLTPHRNRDAETDGVKDGIIALELTYMALLPKFRRRGLAQMVLKEIIRIAETVEAQRIVLAVDLENLPAKKLYQRSGWTEVATETVLGLQIAP